MLPGIGTRCTPARFSTHQTLTFPPLAGAPTESPTAMQCGQVSAAQLSAGHQLNIAVQPTHNTMPQAQCTHSLNRLKHESMFS